MVTNHGKTLLNPSIEKTFAIIIKLMHLRIYIITCKCKNINTYLAKAATIQITQTISKFAFALEYNFSCD